MNDIPRYPTKQNYLSKHPQKRYHDESSVISTHNKQSPPSELKLLSKMSDIRVVNDFSVDSQYFDRSSILEQSLEQDLRYWQQQYKVDQNVVDSVEQQIRNLDNQIVQLSTQFDVSLNMHQKTEAKFIEFQQLMKGTEFTKFSRSNCKKSAKRLIFYSPFLDAICWKSKSSKLPTIKQTIPIDQITHIHTNYAKYAKIKKNFTLPSNLDLECFIAIEAKNGVKLELLADSRHHQQLYTKTLNLLINKSEDQATHVFIEQYSGDINQIRRNLDKSKECFIGTIEKLQQTFISTTHTLMNQEKEKIQTIKKKSHHRMLQNKLQLDDLSLDNLNLRNQLNEITLERDYLEQRISQIQDNFHQKQLQLKNTNNPQIVAIQQAIHEIIGLNGDQSVYSESQYEYNPEDNFQDCIRSLRKLRTLYETSQNMEIELRTNLATVQHDNTQIQQEKYNLQSDVQEAQLYIHEIENVNQLLQYKLQNLNNDLELKEQQFKLAIDEMQQLQETFPQFMQQTNECRQLKIDNEKLKEALQNKLADLRSQILKEEKNQLTLFVSFVSYLQSQCSHDDYIGEPFQIIQNLSHKLSEKANQLKIYSTTNFMAQLAQQIKLKSQFFMRNHNELFEKQLKEQFQFYGHIGQKLGSPQSTQNSNRVIDKTYLSPPKLINKLNSKGVSQHSYNTLDAKQISYLSQLIK